MGRGRIMSWIFSRFDFGLGLRVWKKEMGVNGVLIGFASFKDWKWGTGVEVLDFGMG